MLAYSEESLLKIDNKISDLKKLVLEMPQFLQSHYASFVNDQQTHIALLLQRVEIQKISTAISEILSFLDMLLSEFLEQKEIFLLYAQLSTDVSIAQVSYINNKITIASCRYLAPGKNRTQRQYHRDLIKIVNNYIKQISAHKKSP